MPEAWPLGEGAGRCGGVRRRCAGSVHGGGNFANGRPVRACAVGSPQCGHAQKCQRADDATQGEGMESPGCVQGDGLQSIEDSVV